MYNRPSLRLQLRNKTPPGTPMRVFKIVPLIKTVCQLTSSLIGVNREHDIAVFYKLDSILDESRMKTILNYSFFTECLRLEERELLYRFADGLQSLESKHLHPVIGLRAKQLASEMSQLWRIVDSTFSSDDGEMFYFRPDPKDPTAYDREWDKLHNAIEQAWQAYKAYRQVVKDRLKV